MGFSSLSASQGASRSSGGQSSSLFMNVPPTTDYGSISDGFIRLSSVAPVSSSLRNRYRALYQPGQSRYVGGPQNSGDSRASQEAQGGGSFSTSTRKS